MKRVHVRGFNSNSTELCFCYASSLSVSLSLSLFLIRSQWSWWYAPQRHMSSTFHICDAMDMLDEQGCAAQKRRRVNYHTSCILYETHFTTMTTTTTMMGHNLIWASSNDDGNGMNFDWAWPLFSYFSCCASDLSLIFQWKSKEGKHVDDMSCDIILYVCIIFFFFVDRQ